MSSTSKIRDKLSFILYQDKASPTYYQFSRARFRFLFIVLPFLAFIAISLCFAGIIYFKHIRRIVEKQEPKIISDLRIERESLIEKQKSLVIQQKQLEAKLAVGSTSDSEPGLGSLALFKHTPNRQNLSQSPELSLDEFETKTIQNKLQVEFKITNLTTNNKKIAGYLFVIMQEGSRLRVWPPNSFFDQEMYLDFSKGELFATSRFRPVLATFNKPNENELLFKVLVFNRLGDLIFKKLISHTL